MRHWQRVKPYAYKEQHTSHRQDAYQGCSHEDGFPDAWETQTDRARHIHGQEAQRKGADDGYPRKLPNFQITIIHIYEEPSNKDAYGHNGGAKRIIKLGQRRIRNRSRWMTLPRPYP